MTLGKKSLIWFLLIGFLSVIVNADLTLAEGVPPCLEPVATPCPPFPNHQDTVPSTGTFRALVVYACGSDAPADTLPDWWASIWDTATAAQHTVPRYFKDNSLGKYLLIPTLYGRDTGHCFRIIIPVDFV